MAYYLIDFENRSRSSFNGFNYLTSEDKVIVFYSNITAQTKLETEFIYELESIGCEIESFKLSKTGKNALDFFIATKVGELFGAGYTGDIAIISCDSGYLAVKEFWSNANSIKRNVVLAPDIINAYKYLMQQITEKKMESGSKYISIDNFFKNRKKNNEQMCALEKRLADLAEIDNEMIAEVKKIVTAYPIGRKRFTETLHRFGRKNGLKIYNRIKDYN